MDFVVITEIVHNGTLVVDDIEGTQYIKDNIKPIDKYLYSY